MERIRGRITHLRVYVQEGGRDWALSLSRLLWWAMWVLLPISIFRAINFFFGLTEAIIGILFLAVILRVLGPLNFLMLDEILSRIFPTLRSAIRMGIMRVYDFRLRTEDDHEHACILRGDLVGSGPVQGDNCELEGRTSRGTFFVSRGINRTTGAHLASYPCHTGWIFIISVFLLVLMVLYLTGVLDPIIESFFL